ncbi:hypothetical protein LF1_48710 [Rubripirellula obstinata]|uniref:Uncharacterized protein n=1 Tax=Rubripirellula obstinata TaxID=406547 RepID=A0A5B1CM95_9BACT|nr:hypothetical protein [Rubripirellula obstinata]KAA1262307.1 hypothetical protein LF1_48710 [Rubripirellula obstinata]
MARIRTIKPEFWQNQELAALAEHSRLLAIALLNHCDDEGYFQANVALVRAACFPFDHETSKVTDSLAALAAIGYIEVREDLNGKRIGKVCKFSDHQRINRPCDSKLRDAFDAVDECSVNTHGGLTEESVSTHGGLTEDSPLERKGTGKGSGTGKGTGTACAESVCVPSKPPPKPRKSRAASRPTLIEVQEHCRVRGSSVDPETFHAWYESRGWKSGGNPIVDWKAAVVTWEKRNEKEPKSRGSRPSTFAEIRTDNTRRAIAEVFSED